MSEALSPLVTGVTPLVNALERVQDVIQTRPVVDEPTTEQAADIVDARDTLQKIRQDRTHSRIGRIAGATGKGARFGGLGIGAKFGLIFGGQHDPMRAIAAGAGLGAVSGGAIAGGLEAFDILSEKRRRSVALNTLQKANPQLRARLQDRGVANAARRYGVVRNAPLLGAEFLGTLGGIAGSAAGIRAVPPSGETIKAPLGFDVDRAQLVNAGKWGLGGIAAGGAVGLLAGLLWKRHRKKKLIDRLMNKTAELTLDIDVGDTLLGGRYKNSPMEVKEIGTDELGQPTVNGRKLLSYRIKKKMPKTAAHYDYAELNRRSAQRRDPDNNPPAKKLWLTTAGGIQVFLVSGEEVRNAYGSSFIGGANYISWSAQIPKNEIWIESEIAESDRPFILIHELYELKLMEMGHDYHTAHDAATGLEDQVRALGKPDQKKEARSKTTPIPKSPEDPKDPWPSTNAPEFPTQTGGNPVKASNRRLMKGLGGPPERYSLGRLVKSAVESVRTTDTGDSPEQNLKSAAKEKLRSRSEVVIYDDKGILGIKKDGYLLMPGGGVDDGETPEATCYREAVEEADRKLLHLTPAGVVEAVWPEGMELVDGFDGERTYLFRALDGGELGTEHDDNEGFKIISFADAKKFLESLIDNDDHAWAREANTSRLQCIVAAENNAEEGITTPVKLAAKDQDQWLRSLCRVHATLAKVADEKAATPDLSGEKAPKITAGPRTTLMAEDEPDLLGGDPAVLIDLDGTVRDWSADGKLRNLGSQFVLPNRKETLRPLKDAGCRIIGVTNHSCHADEAHHGLTHEMLNQLQHETLGLTEGYLDDIVYSPDPDPEILKPKPTMLHYAMKRFGIDPKRAIMVGDHPPADGKAAEAAGIPYHHVDEFFRDPKATIALVLKHLQAKKVEEKTADALTYQDRPEFLYFNHEGKVLAAPDKDRRFRFPLLNQIAGKAAPYEPSLRYVPPEGAAEPGVHGYNINFNTAEAPADLADLQGGEWQEPDQVLKGMYGSMGLKQNAPYRDLDRARARVLLRAHRQRMKQLAAQQAAAAPAPIIPPVA